MKHKIHCTRPYCNGVVQNYEQFGRHMAKIHGEGREEEPSDLEKIEQMSGECDVRVKCDNCGFKEDYADVDTVRGFYERHWEKPHDDCTEDDVHYLAICPRHGRISLDYDECDECRDTMNTMNRLA